MMNYDPTTDPNFDPFMDCHNCGHPWYAHSFYGETRSECQRDCECSTWYNPTDPQQMI